MTVTSLNWHSTKPTVPVIGDCYFDITTDQGFIWQGTAWIAFSGNPVPAPPFMPPTDEQLEKHPSLKEAWEDFLVIKKLLGV